MCPPSQLVPPCHTRTPLTHNPHPTPPHPPSPAPAPPRPVWYEIYSLSRPAHWITTLTHVLLRAYQHKFARESMAAMQREMAAAEVGRR